MKPRCLDLFCGAGGCSAGYARAGYDVTGVDHESQPRYPFRFVLGDALEYVEVHGHEYDLIHASPPCQRFIRLAKQQQTHLRHPDVIEATRRALRATGRPYVIENVEGAPLMNPLTLCGTMFGLRVIRHRLFETEPTIWWPPCPCAHPKQGPGRRGNDGTREWVSVYGHFSGVPKARAAMGIDWPMTQHELAQAIPPAYAEWIGEQIIKAAFASR